MFKRSLLLTATLALGWWLWPEQSVTAQAVAPAPQSGQSVVSVAAAGQPASVQRPPAEQPETSERCQLPDRNQYEEHRLSLRKKLQGYLQQQLLDAVPYTELQLSLPSQYLLDLEMAQQQLLAKHAKNPQPIADHNEALQQLQQSPGTPQAKVQQIKNSALFDASFISPDGFLIPFTLRSMLLSVAGHDLTLLRSALADVELNGNDYAVGLKLISADTLQLLLQKTKAPAEFRMQGMNLADIAVLFFRVDLLPLLASYNIKPTQVPGQYSALDLAFSAPDWQAPALKPASPQHIAQDREQTIRYLQQRGYVLHASKTQTDNVETLTVHSIWNLAPVRQDNQYGQIIADPARLKLAEQQQLEAIQPVQVSEALSTFLQPLQQSDQQFESANQSCQQARDKARLAQGLWPEAQISHTLNAAKNNQPALDVVALHLHQTDPALAGRVLPARKDVRVAPLTEQNRARVIARLQNAGSAEHAGFTLKYLQYDTTLAGYWQPQPTNSLQMLFKGKTTEAFWRELLAQGFSLHLQDIYGRNLYPQAFAAGPDAVALLLEENVAVDQPAVGPDALDLALDQSYLDKKLHPAVVSMMQKMGKPETSHLSRLRRLQQYQPAVFTALQQALAKEPLLLGWLDDLSSYEANPVLAVANE